MVQYLPAARVKVAATINRIMKERYIMTVLRGHADKRTAEQRANDVAQDARPKGAQDKTAVTTGPATGKEDERAVGTEDAR